MMRLAALFLLHIVLCSAASAQVTLVHNSANTCTAPCSAVAVIFVHGLTGSEETWVEPRSGQSFPKLLAEDSQLKDSIDVYTLQYQSLWNSGPPIVEVTTAVADRLDPLLKEKRYSKVVFVAHSLGGNIASEYLVHVTLNYGHVALSRFPLVITLGTPFEGASLAGLASLFSNNAQIRSLLDIHKNDFLQLLTNSREDFLKKRINHHCAPLEFAAGFETLPVGALLVVSEPSGDGRQGFAKDHLSLPKPAGRNDEVYIWVSKEIGFCVGGLSCKGATNPDPICSVGDF
jgi:pimeloyl-ACP methyl ester carboxylesterase